MKCKKCNEELVNGAKFCFSCGTKVEMSCLCSSCGTELKSGMQFCFNCGTKIFSENDVKENNIDIFSYVPETMDEKKAYINEVFKNFNEGYTMFKIGSSYFYAGPDGGIYYIYLEADSDIWNQVIMFRNKGYQEAPDYLKKKAGHFIPQRYICIKNDIQWIGVSNSGLVFVCSPEVSKGLLKISCDIINLRKGITIHGNAEYYQFGEVKRMLVHAEDATFIFDEMGNLLFSIEGSYTSFTCSSKTIGLENSEKFATFVDVETSSIINPTYFPFKIGSFLHKENSSEGVFAGYYFGEKTEQAIFNPRTREVILASQIGGNVLQWADKNGYVLNDQDPERKILPITHSNY